MPYVKTGYKSKKQAEHLERARKILREKKARGEIVLGRPKSLATLKREADKDAREKFLLFASTHVLPVSDVLVAQAMTGDVAAIKEFFDRAWGKAPQSIDHRLEVKFSLVDLAKKRGVIDGNADMTVLGAPRISAPKK